jgi:hypothetical protein
MKGQSVSLLQSDGILIMLGDSPVSAFGISLEVSFSDNLASLSKSFIF